MRVVLTFLLVSAMAFSQSFQGSLRGRVTDSTDAVVPVAKVTVIQDGTNVSSGTVTNTEGEYSFPALAPASYTLQVEAPGFKKAELKEVVIPTQTAVARDVKLELGAVTETINVTADAEMLNTSDASTGTVLDRGKIEDLPNLGRNPFILARLSEAVVWTGNPKFNRMEDQSGSAAISIAGGPLQTNNYTLDGISITDSTNRAVIIPDQESVGEMKVQANTYDASMGRTGGGVFNTTLRSGANRMHGSLFGALRETDWGANNFFSNKAGQPRAQATFKNYGDSLGGPVRIPKVYNGLNKTFFFVTTEGYRQYDANSGTLSVPTAAERTGDFSKSLTPAKTPWLMYDPLSTNLSTGARTPFTNNIIPASQLSPIGLKLASYYPLPNQPTASYGAANYIYSITTQDRADQGTFKLDHEFAPWLKASASYLHYGSQEPSNQTFPGSIATPGQTIIYRQVDATQLNATATVTPTTVVTARFGFNRFPDYEPKFSHGFQLSELGFPSAVDALTPGNPDFPSITAGEFAAFGGGTTSWTVYHSTSFNAEVAKFMGKHSIKAGFERRLIGDAFQTATGPSSFVFASGFTSQSAAKTVTGTGGGLASMLLGYPGSGTANGGSITVGTKYNQYVYYTAFFIQDDFRITPKLTLNFGFRGEHESNPAESNNRYFLDADLSKPNPLQASIPSLTLMGQTRYAGVGGNPNHAGNPMGLKPGPRIGFAYNLNPKTVFRGGFGIFWVPQSFSATDQLGYSQTTSIVGSTNGGYTPASTLANPYPNGLTATAGNSLGAAAALGQAITATDPGNRSAGYVEQMSLDIQRQLDSKTTIQAGYIGSHTLKLPFTVNLNQLNPSYFGLGAAGLNKAVANPFYGLVPSTVSLGSSPTIAQSSLLLPYPEYTNVNLTTPMGRAIYYAGYVKGTRRMTAGLTLNATYTWSRSMGMASGTSANAVQDYTAAIVPQTWTRLATDQPNSFSMAFTYQLPFGKGQMFLNGGGPLNWLVGGWSIQSQSLIHSGTPLAVTQGTNSNTGCNGCTQLPTATGVSAQTSGSVVDRIYQWVNPAAFTVTPAYSFGNVSPRINVYSPPLFNIDASLFKTVTFKEHFKFQFRAEALNLTNTVLFASPALNVSSPSTFGVITSQTNFPRLLQLGGRITF